MRAFAETPFQGDGGWRESTEGALIDGLDRKVPRIDSVGLDRNRKSQITKWAEMLFSMEYTGSKPR